MARYGYGWRPYVSVAQRRAQAQRKMNALRKKGVDIQPVEIEGRRIAKSFWGKAWCDHLESFSDFANRLPRGRTYVRNGSVCHLEISEGEVKAKVAGSAIYDLHIQIETLPAKKWKALKKRCAGQIGSLLELLQGKLSNQVMMVVSDQKEGLFPLPAEISLKCNCPDWARMCKHVAAVLYGVGARLDQQPELLFKLRGVDHEELIAADAEAAVSAATSKGKAKRLATGDLADVFGIDLDMSNDETESAATKKAPKRSTSNIRRKKVTKKRTAAKKPTKKSTKKVGKRTPLKKNAKKKSKKGVDARTPKKKTTKKKVKKKAAKGTTGANAGTTRSKSVKSATKNTKKSKRKAAKKARPGKKARHK